LGVGLRVGVLVAVEVLLGLLVEVLVGVLLLARLGLDVDLRDRVAAVAAGGVRVAAVAGAAAEAAEPGAVAAVAAPEVDVGLAVEGEVAAVATGAEAVAAVRAAAVAAGGDAAVARVAGRGVGVGVGDLVLLGCLGVVLLADLGGLGLLRVAEVLDEVVVEVELLVDVVHEGVEVEAAGHRCLLERSGSGAGLSFLRRAGRLVVRLPKSCALGRPVKSGRTPVVGRRRTGFDLQRRMPVGDFPAIAGRS
jgi:hypothetical protein